MVRVSQLSGLGAGADELVDLIDSIPLITRAQAQSAVDKLTRAVADAAEARVEPRVEAGIKKGIMVSIGASLALTVLVVRLSR